MSNGSAFTIIVRFRIYLGVRAEYYIRKTSFAPEVDLDFVGHNVFNSNSVARAVLRGSSDCAEIYSMWVSLPRIIGKR